jgi:RHS repeat-associated protein
MQLKKYLLCVLATLSVIRAHADSTQMTTLAIAAGQNQGMALRADGTVWTWGNNTDGEMGIAGVANSAFPLRISGFSGVSGIAAGWTHSLAVQSNGTVWAWGTNSSGQLGTGNFTSSGVPTQVSVITNAVAVSAGSAHSLALLSNGKVMAWGTNAQEQLGNGTTTSTNQPTFVSTLTNIVKVAAGGFHSVALDSNGVVWVWGYGAEGEIGNGLNNFVSTPVSVLSNVVDIAAGGFHTVALEKDGSVWTWGRNANGQLGLGNTTSVNVPTLVISGAQTIGAGFENTGVTLTNGQNFICGFINGNTTALAPLSPAPPFTKYAFGTTPDSVNFAFGMATNGAVWAWGVNVYGQFGNGNTFAPFDAHFEYVPTESFAPTPPNRSGEFVRGNAYDFTGAANDLDYSSIVVPIDLEQGVQLNEIGNDSYCYSNSIPWFLSVANQTLFVPTAISSGTNLAVIPVSNPLAAFGSEGGGSQLYPNQPYRFGVYAGGFDESDPNCTNVIRISVYDRTLFTGSTTNIAPTNVFTISLPRRTVTADSNLWDTFMSNGASTTFTSNGLTTTVEFLDNENPNDKPFGLTWLTSTVMPTYFLTGYKLTHTASSTNFFYRIEVLGKVQVGATTLAPMATNSSGTWTALPLYTLGFDQPNPLQSQYVSTVFFQGTPMPPTYESANIVGPAGVTTLVTNQYSLTNTTYTNLDGSPDLRRHPLLDQFVLDMNKDPLALASYVINQIELTDPYAHAQSSPTVNPIVTCGGVDRSALGTFLEGQGSPVEQCELLVYLLRQAGYPAAYVFPTNNNLYMTADHISQLWRVQVKGVLYPNGIPHITNSLLTVNYPWVVVNVGTNTYHIWPWLKDTEIVEGPNFYDYLPTNYNTALKWVENYVRGDTNILNLDSEDIVSKLLPEFIQQYLNPQSPTLSLDSLGVRAFNRHHQYPTWNYLPQPDAVTNLGTLSVVDNLNDTGSFPYLASMFNTAQVKVYSNSPTGTLLFDTGTWYSCDLDNRKFLIFTNGGNLSLWLAPYRTNVTAIQGFSTGAPSSTALQSNSVATGSLTTLAVQVMHHRQYASLTSPTSQFPVGESSGSTNVAHCNMGDTAAIALDFGRITPLMLQQHAETYWALQRQKATNSSFVPPVADFQGTAAYLLGTQYFQKVDAFDANNQQWHKVHGLVKFSSGLGVIGSTPTITNMQAKVDMVNDQEVFIGNGSLRPDDGEPDFSALQNYDIFFITAGSAEEHDILNTMFPDQSAISTVRLLQLAQARATNGNSPILELYSNNVVAAGNLSYTGYGATLLKNQDPSVWAAVTNIFTQIGGDFARVIITPGPITNAPQTYVGMGALVLSYNLEQALISGNTATLHGGWGSELGGFTAPPSTPVFSYDLDLNPDGYSFAPNNGVSGTTIDPAPDPITIAGSTSTGSTLTLTTEQTQQGQQTGATTGQSGSPANNNVVAANEGAVGNPSAGSRSVLQTIADPVNVTSGEFYVDTVDISLPGPFPLDLRRNYTSQNLQCNEFGYGWKINFNPYLVLASSNLIYGAELDGAVIAYRFTNSAWKVLPQDNPSLNNNSTYGTGGTANLFNSVLTTNSGTNYIITAPDGSIRTYETMTFPVASGTNVLSRTRPYLVKWQDHAGNYALFFYGTNQTADDWGQLNRINMANGNTLVFKYDFNGRITQGITGDGRFVNYDYDTYGDLITVTLPDASQCQYQYQHYTATTNSTTYTDSTHLITQEIKPNGRIVGNWYDSLRRVTNQASTVGTNLVLVTNAYFFYTNNITSLTNQFASGVTRVDDFFHNPTLYYYNNNMITNVVDPLGHSNLQVFFLDSQTNLTGFYPRSLQFSVDKRGLTNQYFYDSFGNVTQIVLRGDITGSGIVTESATNNYTYTSKNLPNTSTDPVGNITLFTYDGTDPFLLTAMIHSNGVTSISTNTYFYTNVSQLSSIGTTNFAFGLRWRTILTGGATNDSMFDGRGFKTEQIQYPATADVPTNNDPAVITYFNYNALGQLYQQQTAGGGIVQATFDPMNRVESKQVFDQNSNSLSQEFYYYNRNGELEWYDGPRFNPDDFVYHIYDGAGREIQQIHWRSQGKLNGSGVEAPAGNNQFATTFKTFDGFGNLTSITDARGVVTTNLFDALGRTLQTRVLETNGSVLKTEQFAYEAGGLVTKTTNSLGGVTTTLYNSVGKPRFRSNPDGSTNGWTYYLDGRTKREFQGNGAFYETTYDDVNRKITRIFYTAASASLATNVTSFDRRGNAIRNTDAAGNTFTNMYDGLDRIKWTAGPMISFTNPAGVPSIGSPPPPIQEVTTNFYDAAGLALTNINAFGESTITYLDVLGRVTKKEIRDASNTQVRVSTTTYSPDHQSATSTAGSGASAIVTTTYTDNDGHPVLNIVYPAPGVVEYTLSQYDLVGNLINTEHVSSTNGAQTVWTTASFAYDGLNRVISKTDRDGAVTQFAYDQESNLTNRLMPGGVLSWQATYNNAGEILTEKNVGSGGTTARSDTYSYYSSGSFVGLLQTQTDGRGVACTHTYDDYLRPLTLTYTNSAGGSPPEQSLSTTFGYEVRGMVNSITEGFATNTTGPASAITRSYDPYGFLGQEFITLNGTNFSGAGQLFDSAGRRAALGLGGFGYSFAYRPDGLLVANFGSSGGAGYTYDNAGNLLTRSVTPRVTSITQRDGVGRPLSISTTVNSVSTLAETLGYTGDGLIASHTIVRPDFTDTRSYSYANLSRRLTQEVVTIGTTNSWTNTFTYDGGATGGLGIITRAGQPGTTGAIWKGAADALSRISAETNSVAHRTAYGRVNGLSTVSVTLDGQPMPVNVVNTGAEIWTNRWEATLEMTPGAHTLVATAKHPSGLFTTNTSVIITNNASDTAQDVFSADGEMTQRIWKRADGTTNRTQTLSWDAKGRLYKVVELDDQTNGYNWQAVYDALGRRLKTTTIIVTNGVTLSAQASSINQYYDPQFEFLELGITTGGKTTSKIYGPDLNGTYGGMNGTGGLDAIVPQDAEALPVLSDARGNVLAFYNVGTLATTWNAARPTGYGSVPGYAPPPLGFGGSLVQSSAWRGRWADITGHINLGARPYSPQIGAFDSFDPSWNDSDPNGYTFAGGEPIRGFDSNGRIATQYGNSTAAGQILNGTANALNNYANSSQNSFLGPLASFAGQLFSEASGAQNPGTALNGAISFGNNVNTVYNDSGLVTAGSYALTSWNVGAIWSGVNNIDLATGQPVGDGFQRGTLIANGVAGTTAVVGVGDGIFNWATAPAAPPVIATTDAAAASADAAITGDTSASAPVGRSGQPINVSTADGIPSNTPTTIAGRDYVGHALDSMQSRGIPPSVVENTIQQGVASPGNIAGRTVYFDSVNNISVVTDTASGRVITVRAGPP